MTKIRQYKDAYFAIKATVDPTDIWLIQQSDGVYKKVTSSAISGAVTLSGDITGSGSGSIATTISNSAVSLAKMANLSANSIIGNNTGSSATPIALSASQVKIMLSLNNVENTALSSWSGSANITTLGTIASGTWSGTAIDWAKGGTGLTALGTGLQYLRTNAGATAMEWATLTAITGTLNANYIPVANGASALTDSVMYNNSGKIGIGTTTAGSLIDLNNTASVDMLTVRTTATGGITNYIAKSDGRNFFGKSTAESSWHVFYGNGGSYGTLMLKDTSAGDCRLEKKTTSYLVQQILSESTNNQAIVAGSYCIYSDAPNGIRLMGANSVQMFTSYTTSSRALLVDSSGIKTADPNGASTAGYWKLGKLITSAVTADTTRYLEVLVEGVVYKLIVST